VTGPDIDAALEAYRAERAAAQSAGAANTARLAALLWDQPALGAHRHGHQPPPWPDDAPPLPPARPRWSAAQLAAAARALAADTTDRTLDAEVIVTIGRRDGLSHDQITAALAELLP
jgi:hypothetical protein